MNYPDDILELIAKTRSGFGEAKTIEDVTAAWHHFHLVEGYVERTWPDDKHTMEALGRAKSGLSAYTRDVRESMPSPYHGWSADLFALERCVRPQYDKDGWPH